MSVPVDTTEDRPQPVIGVFVYPTPSFVVRYEQLPLAVVGPGSSAVVPYGTVGADLPAGSILVSGQPGMVLGAP